jgi:hypothetical protein
VVNFLLTMAFLLVLMRMPAGVRGLAIGRLRLPEAQASISGWQARVLGLLLLTAVPMAVFTQGMIGHQVGIAEHPNDLRQKWMADLRAAAGEPDRKARGRAQLQILREMAFGWIVVDSALMGFVFYGVVLLISSVRGHPDEPHPPDDQPDSQQPDSFEEHQRVVVR